jgi:hypothetical protein
MGQKAWVVGKIAFEACKREHTWQGTVQLNHTAKKV